jgi:hypothetical protein
MFINPCFLFGIHVVPYLKFETIEPMKRFCLPGSSNSHCFKKWPAFPALIPSAQCSGTSKTLQAQSSLYSTNRVLTHQITTGLQRQDFDNNNKQAFVHRNM